MPDTYNTNIEAYRAKFEYLLETKRLLKEALNTKLKEEDQLTDISPFRNYVDKALSIETGKTNFRTFNIVQVKEENGLYALHITEAKGDENDYLIGQSENDTGTLYIIQIAGHNYIPEVLEPIDYFDMFCTNSSAINEIAFIDSRGNIADIVYKNKEYTLDIRTHDKFCVTRIYDVDSRTEIYSYDQDTGETTGSLTFTTSNDHVFFEIMVERKTIPGEVPIAYANLEYNKDDFTVTARDINGNIVDTTELILGETYDFVCTSTGTHMLQSGNTIASSVTVRKEDCGVGYYGGAVWLDVMKYTETISYTFDCYEYRDFMDMIEYHYYDMNGNEVPNGELLKNTQYIIDLFPKPGYEAQFEELFDHIYISGSEVNTFPHTFTTGDYNTSYEVSLKKMSVNININNMYYRLPEFNKTNEDFTLTVKDSNGNVIDTGLFDANSTYTVEVTSKSGATMTSIRIGGTTYTTFPLTFTTDDGPYLFFELEYTGLTGLGRPVGEIIRAMDCTARVVDALGNEVTEVVTGETYTLYIDKASKGYRPPDTVSDNSPSYASHNLPYTFTVSSDTFICAYGQQIHADLVINAYHCTIQIYSYAHMDFIDASTGLDTLWQYRIDVTPEPGYSLKSLTLNDLKLHEGLPFEFMYSTANIVAICE